MSDFKGRNESKLEVRVLNQSVSDKDLILASFNPLVEALCNTTVQMIFSKPFYHVVRGKDKKIDREMSEQVGDIFDNINFIEHAMVAAGDAFDYGPGQFELSMGKNSETKWIEFDAASRRPADTFKRPKNTKIVSTSQRWKGIHEVDGVKYFDQTVDGTKIVSLDPKRMFHMTPNGAKFPDGPGLTEMLIPFLDGCQFAYNMSFVVMAEQLNPKELQITDENLPGTGQIVSDILTSNNGIEKYPLPPNVTMNYPQYKDREDVHKFFKFYEQIMYRIVYPIACLTSSDGGGGILDNSSNIVKSQIFYDHISSWRSKVARGTNPLGNYLLDINGWKKKGYKYELIPSPIAARDIEIEAKIMNVAVENMKVSTSEYRAWLNSVIQGLRLENEDFEEQIQEGKKVQAPVSENIKNKMQKIEKGADPSSTIEEVVARRVA
jgi:hypothetical protein